MQTWARAARPRPADRDRPPRASPTGLIPDAEWRNDGYRRYRAASSARASSSRQAALFAAAGSTGPGRRATTSTSPSARATCRPRRCRWRSPTRRSPTAARSCARTSGRQVEDGQGRVVQELRRPPRAAGQDRPERPRQAIMDGLRRAASEAGRHVRGRLRRAGQARDPVYGKTGTVERGSAQPDQSWYVAYVHDTSPRPIVVVVTVEKGGFGAETAAPAARLILAQWFASATSARPARHDAASSTPPVSARRARRTPSADRRARPRPRSRPRSEPPLRLDPLLALAVLGLVRLLRWWRSSARTADDIPGEPDYYVERQARLRGRRAADHVRPLAAGLLAPARAQVRALRR